MDIHSTAMMWIFAQASTGVAGCAAEVPGRPVGRVLDSGGGACPRACGASGGCCRGAAARACAAGRACRGARLCGQAAESSAGARAARRRCALDQHVPGRLAGTHDVNGALSQAGHACSRVKSLIGVFGCLRACSECSWLCFPSVFRETIGGDLYTAPESCPSAPLYIDRARFRPCCQVLPPGFCIRQCLECTKAALSMRRGSERGRPTLGRR